ncbi:MAG: hypothetical protein AAFR61_14905 [Bacteroidota bacterium]
MLSRFVFLICCWGLLMPSLFAQKPAEVQVFLDNGWILKGDTSLLPLTKKIAIQTVEGQQFVFGLHQVDSIKPLPVAPRLKQGYFGLYQLGVYFHNPEPNPFTDANSPGNFYFLTLQTVQGYRFNDGFSLGFATGLHLLAKGYILPLMLDMRGDLNKGKIRWHYYLQGGHNLPLYDLDDIPGWGNRWQLRDFKASGRFMSELGLGLRLPANDSYDLIFTAGYHRQRLVESYWAWGSFFEDVYTLNRLTMQVGLMF